MKKIIYSLSAAALFTLSMQAQNAIPNGNFENWTTGTTDELMFYSTANSQTFYQSGVFNCLKVANPYHGSFAVQLNTVAVGTDTSMAFIVNSPNPGGGNPCQWPGGVACTSIPSGIRGYYKNNSVSIDSGGILVAFKNGATCLGLYMYKFGGVHNTYTPFQFVFNPPIAGTPDTMVFAAISSDVFNNVQRAGNMLQLDSISFTGIAQPANFNGDFELWQPQTYEKPNSWYINSNGGNGITGVQKTTDKNAGSYAVQLTTYLNQKNNGTPMANGARVSTGYYPNCNGPCNQKGGYPFTNPIDTLCFYYKYAPMNNDSGFVDMTFKKNGSQVTNRGRNIYPAAATYQYMEVPFNTMNPIDSVIVSFESTIWRDSATTFVGSVLKIDDVHFKSQPLNGIKTYNATAAISIYPNPASDGTFTISNVDYYDLVRVYNVFGQEVNASITKQNNEARVQINTPGAYFVFINSRGKITNQKVIVGKE